MDNIKSLAAERRLPAEVDRAEAPAAAKDDNGSRAQKFSTAFKENLDRIAMANSGKAMPQSGIDSPVQAPDNSELKSRTLEGGLKLLLGGKEPTEESVMAFAKSQGLEAGALAMLAQGQMNQGQNSKLPSNRMQLSIVKLEAIHLESFAPEIARTGVEGAGRLNPLAAPQINVGPVDGTTPHSQVGEVRVDLTEKSSVETKSGGNSGTNGADQEAWRKHDQQQDMSRRLAEVLGQRLSAQIARGAWRVEMDIHPKSLGRIEIQLEMKNGELQAHFNASKLVTREMLQESLPKLREALDQHGIDSAFIGVGAGSGQQGDSTGHKPAEERPQRFSQSVSPTTEPSGNGLRRRVTSNGLDIEV
jgi:flagellar hook-length control protein FliK